MAKINLGRVVGEDGREIELTNDGTHIKWRYVGDEEWINLLDVSDIGSGNSTSIVDTYADLPADAAEGDLAYVRNDTIISEGEIIDTQLCPSQYEGDLDCDFPHIKFGTPTYSSDFPYSIYDWLYLQFETSDLEESPRIMPAGIIISEDFPDWDEGDWSWWLKTNSSQYEYLTVIEKNSDEAGIDYWYDDATEEWRFRVTGGWAYGYDSEVINGQFFIEYMDINDDAGFAVTVFPGWNRLEVTGYVGKDKDDDDTLIVENASFVSSEAPEIFNVHSWRTNDDPERTGVSNPAILAAIRDFTDDWFYDATKSEIIPAGLYVCVGEDWRKS